MAQSATENTDSKERFSSRVDAYREFRPRYPVEVIDLLRQHCGLTPASVIADIGAGTGMLAELFLQHSNSVFAIEPNRAMRSACEGFALAISQTDVHRRFCRSYNPARSLRRLCNCRPGTPLVPP